MFHMLMHEMCIVTSTQLVLGIVIVSCTLAINQIDQYISRTSLILEDLKYKNISSARHLTR